MSIPRYRAANTFPFNGEWVGNFLLIKRIGHGSEGCVYEAQDAGTGASVALKLIPKTVKSFENIKQEYTLARKCESPQVLKHLGLFETKRYSVMLTELCIGTFRKKYLETNPGGLDIAMFLILLYQILVGINTLHKKGIVWNDCKPDHILLGKDGKLKLADLGHSKSFSNREPPQVYVKGTPGYQAPEMFQRCDGYLADIWSCACVAYEMYAGIQARNTYGQKHGETSCQFGAFKSAFGTMNFPIPKNIPENETPIVDFIARLLAIDPKIRFTTDQALDHYIFNAVRGIVPRGPFVYPPINDIVVAFMAHRLETNKDKLRVALVRRQNNKDVIVYNLLVQMLKEERRGVLLISESLPLRALYDYESDAFEEHLRQRNEELRMEQEDALMREQKAIPEQADVHHERLLAEGSVVGGSFKFESQYRDDGILEDVFATEGSGLAPIRFKRLSFARCEGESHVLLQQPFKNSPDQNNEAENPDDDLVLLQESRESSGLDDRLAKEEGRRLADQEANQGAVWRELPSPSNDRAERDEYFEPELSPFNPRILADEPRSDGTSSPSGHFTPLEDARDEADERAIFAGERDGGEFIPSGQPLNLQVRLVAEELDNRDVLSGEPFWQIAPPLALCPLEQPELPLGVANISTASNSEEDVNAHRSPGRRVVAVDQGQTVPLPRSDLRLAPQCDIRPAPNAEEREFRMNTTEVKRRLARIIPQSRVRKDGLEADVKVDIGSGEFRKTFIYVQVKTSSTGSSLVTVTKRQGHKPAFNIIKGKIYAALN
jgi:serine/threonine protein kinase